MFIRSFEPLVAHPTSFIMSNNIVDQDPFPITVAQLSGNFCETIFFGIYLAISTSCVPIFYDVWIKKQQRWGQSSRTRWIITTVALILIVICTFDTILGLVHNIQAFIDSSDPIQEFQKTSSWINLARVSIFSQTFSKVSMLT